MATPTTTPCPRCQGTGSCRDCGGSGLQTCIGCEGKGQRTTPRGLTFTCKTCQGKGKVECPTACVSCAGSGAISEKLQAEVRDKYRPRFVDYSPLARVSMVLLIVNVGLFMLTHSIGPEGARLFTMLANNPYVIVSHEYWRFVTPMFLHVNFVHLGMNSYFLWRFCPQMEGMYGSSAFLALYLTSGLLGDIVSWIGHDGWAGVGASGALYGVGTAYIGLHKRFGLFTAADINPWALYLGGYLIVGFATGILNVDNWGHLGGAIGGLLFTWVMPRPGGRGG